MKTPKYIQDTEWWKVMREKAVKADDKRYHDTLDDTIIKALHTPLQAPESPVRT